MLFIIIGSIGIKIVMSNVRILDCTLRDGGYCNNWLFGRRNTQTIINSLLEANIDVIECGYISNKETYDKDSTRFVSFEQVGEVIPAHREGKLFVAMINLGEFDIQDIPEHNGKSVDGIRVAFHKKDTEKGLEFCRRIKEKGYKVFVQGMVSLAFSDDEFVELINKTNEVEPYAFYIVDSFGGMKEKDLLHLFNLVDQNLFKSIRVGFHSHNNMQLAYSNCRLLTQLQNDRSLIIDTSIYGMGRGAGNLNTELFLEYLNDNYKADYKLNPIILVVDEIIDDFYKRNYWGYSLPNYISAKNNVHPSYASYLDDKKTLTIEGMNEIFLLMDDDKKVRFDKKYIDDLYMTYLAEERVKNEHIEELTELIAGRKVLLIAPGKSVLDEIEKIEDCAKETLCISVNFHHYLSDFVFLSNLRRNRKLGSKTIKKCIVTSNVTYKDAYIQVKYRDLLNSEEAVCDNAGLMAIKFLMSYEVKEILLAGFDGYSHESRDNYAYKHMEFITKNSVLDAMNVGMEKVLNEFAKEIRISFLTTPRNVKISDGRFDE